jgi:hypothetical protein
MFLNLTQFRVYAHTCACVSEREERGRQTDRHTHTEFKGRSAPKAIFISLKFMHESIITHVIKLVCDGQMIKWPTSKTVGKNC